jgi:hypothetical protein
MIDACRIPAGKLTFSLEEKSGRTSARLGAPDPAAAAPPDFAGLAEDLTAALSAPGVPMRARQRCQFASNRAPLLECAPRGGHRGRIGLTIGAGLSEDESHGQASFS